MTQQMEFTPAVSQADRLGQGTAVEQSRAVASVQSMVVAARNLPRDEDAARGRMLRACRSPELADKGLYAYPKGDKIVSDLSIHAAVELARCWGNLDYGLTEMRRDDIYGQSEMLAYCWELETNVCDRHTFIVPHKRSGNGKRLTDTRDIYEVNTNDGNRRMRSAILRQLPLWYRELAKRTLRETLRQLEASGGKSLDEQLDSAAAWFLDEFGVALDQLEFKLGAQRRRWTQDDVVELRILGRSIKAREVTVDDVFPAAKVTVDELAADAAAPANVPAQASPEPDAADAAGHADEDDEAYGEYAAEQDQEGEQ